jgi:DNA primase
MLRPILVANPYARHLTFLDDRTQTRRDHVKYLTLIRSIALLHQYQRDVKTATHDGTSVPYIEVTLDDVAMANKLAHQALGRSLDELPPQTRRLLLALDRMVDEESRKNHVTRSDFRFSRKDVREYTGWTDFQTRTHLDKLVALEYVLVHRGRRGQSFEYELLYEGEGRSGEPFLMGLIDVDQLRKVGYDGKFEHRKRDFEPSLSPQRAPIEPHSSIGRNPLSPGKDAAKSTLAAKAPENADLGHIDKDRRSRDRAASAR